MWKNLKFGLCCQFIKQNIKFKRTTISSLNKLTKSAAAEKLSNISFENILNLEKALIFCIQNKISAFRITSKLFSAITHPIHGYKLSDLPNSDILFSKMKNIKRMAEQNKLRLSFHPDQFIVLNTPNNSTFQNSLNELIMHTEIAEILGIDVINIHGGGMYGNKKEALQKLTYRLKQLSPTILKHLTLENDDKCFTPQDLIPVCKEVGIAFCYDAHHHRILKDKLSIEEATDQAISTWNREPQFHISSPKDGWNNKKPNRHSDYINLSDIPKCWLDKTLTIDVEAKAKELAVLSLMQVREVS